MKLRNEIMLTDWKSIVEKENMDNIMYILMKAELVISSLKNKAGELVDFLKYGIEPEYKDSTGVVDESLGLAQVNKDESLSLAQVELFIPGNVYFIKKTMKTENGKASEIFTLLKRETGQHFQKILLSTNSFEDH